VAEKAGLLLRQHDNPPRSIREPFEHGSEHRAPVNTVFGTLFLLG